MTKAIPVHVGMGGSRKNGRRIAKGMIHLQASLNKTIVTITDVRGRFLGLCWYFCIQSPNNQAAAAIRTVQGMERAGVMIKGPGLGHDESFVEVVYD